MLVPDEMTECGLMSDCIEDTAIEYYDRHCIVIILICTRVI